MNYLHGFPAVLTSPNHSFQLHVFAVRCHRALWVLLWRSNAQNTRMTYFTCVTSESYSTLRWAEINKRNTAVLGLRKPLTKLCPSLYSHMSDSVCMTVCRYANVNSEERADVWGSSAEDCPGEWYKQDCIL